MVYRQVARDLSKNDGTFIEVFVDCPLTVCENRGPKGMYKKARQRILKEFTGASAPYEAPVTKQVALIGDFI